MWGVGKDLLAYAQGFGGMVQRSVDVYDERRVATLSAEIAAAIDAASYGSGEWDAVPATLSTAFPGSWGGLYNMNFVEDRLNFMSLQNMEPTFVQSFAEHFAFVNPWAAYWTSLKRTTIAASEEVCPARSFAKSEFYNDWLLPQKTEAAVGMKVVGDRGEAIHFLLHFPLSRADIYDSAGLEILKRVRGNLERSVKLARMLRNCTESRMTEAALLERSRHAAFVIDGKRRVRDANRLAELLFASGEATTVRRGRCYLGNADADARFGRTLDLIARGLPTDDPSIPFLAGGGAWEVIMAALPTAFSRDSSLLSLLPPQRMVLVLVSDLASPDANVGDFPALSSLYGLTPAEILFCKRLSMGESVAEAAEQAGITLETARTRLKAILQKTGTSRQGKLMLLLSKLR
ncbi:MAG: hypothetical protein J0H84_26600 [Rhizobiales bacterium]|nr:hypothetical protein [Hyphomicrobiales bacterium]